MNQPSRIPVCEPWITDRETELIKDCVSSGWISSAGHYLDGFEQQWAAYCGVKHGVAVSNGTTALEIAVAALGIGPGDEVILPSFTIISCALAVVAARATPVLVDCEPGTWNLDPALVERAITPRTKAIMVVHMYGHPCEMDSLQQLASKHGLAIIEDACQAHGAEYKGRRSGSLGTVSCFSFYANKIITTGEGGMVLTDDDGTAARLRSLRNLCFDKERTFLHDGVGHNYRLTNMQAAIGVAQIARVDEVIARKRHIADGYSAVLRGVEGLELPVERPSVKSVFWMYGVVLGPELNTDVGSVRARLGAAGIETRLFFKGMHQQPIFRKQGLFAGESFPITEKVADRGFYLPSGVTLTEAQVERCATELLRAVSCH